MSGQSGAIRIDPGGLSFTVDVKRDGASIGTAYSAAGSVGPVSLPTVVAAATVLFVPAPGVYAVSCSVAGVEAYTASFSVGEGTSVAIAPDVDASEMVLTTVTTNTEQTVSATKTFADGVDIVVGSSVGTKLGTAASQKLGFFGATPVVRPAALTASNASAVDALYGAEEQAVIGNLRVRVNELEARLRALGILT
jgi:hypothetical protein